MHAPELHHLSHHQQHDQPAISINGNQAVGQPFGRRRAWSAARRIGGIGCHAGGDLSRLAAIEPVAVRQHFLSRRRKQLDDVAVWIAQENLPGPIRPLLFGSERSAHALQMSFPFLEVIHPQREMILVVALEERSAMLGNQVQLLVCSQPKPRAGKSESRARNGFEPQRAAVKLAAPLHVRDVDRHMIQLSDRHVSRLKPRRQCG